MVKLLVVADDFTGALDTGVQFAEKGIPTKILNQASIGKEQLKQIPTDVLVIDAETRHLNGRNAYQRVYEIVKEGKTAGIPYIYKKTDSGLRGNVGFELEAALEASGEQYLTFVPAFPAMNRITVDGIQYVDGKPISESVFGKDPFEPVQSSRVKDLFRDVRVKTHTYKISESRDSSEEKEIGIFDAVREEDICRIADELLENGKMGVMAGCAGFASVLTRRLKLQRKGTEIPTVPSKLLVICGSINDISAVQIQYAQESGMKRFTMTPKQQLTEGYLQTTNGKQWLEELKRTCASGKSCVVDTGGSDTKEMKAYLAQRGMALEGARARIASRLGEVLKAVIDTETDLTAMVIGGDTLQGFMEKAGCSEITVYRELCHGTVLSLVDLGVRKQWLISKSGGFGNPELLIEVENMIKEGGDNG